jgi:hypothetical protein
MKKKILLFTLSAGLAFVSLSSNNTGPAQVNLLNLTGSKGSSSTNCGGAGCHGGNSNNTSVNIGVDSAGVVVTKYAPGKTYNVSITGSNTSNLPKFGYQYSVVSGTGNNQVQAGTISVPANSHIKVLSAISILEHSIPLSGTGTPITYKVATFTWTAPAAGAGTVTMYSTLNAVDGTGGPSLNDLSHNTSITLTEEPVGVAELNQDIAIKAFPNPATSQFNIKMDNAGTGIYNVHVYDLNGRVVFTHDIHATGANTVAVINCANWPKGYYGVQISQNGAQRVLPVVKL